MQSTRGCGGSTAHDGCEKGSRTSPPASLRQGESQWHLPVASAPVLSRSAQDRDWVEHVRHATSDLQQMALPRGFPHTVATGYAGYTGWLAAGLFAHSFTVMVSSNALLSGFFAEMSAASWLAKDLLPPLLAGTLATRIRTLEVNPKKWFGAACFANSILGCAEFLIPHLLPKETWMPLAICTNVGKMTGYLVIGASRAVLQKTLATNDNLGEITAKLGTLGMLMHCCGAAAALTLTQFLGFTGQLAAIVAGAAVGFYAPVRASQCVVMSNVTAVSLRRLVSSWSAARRAAVPWACPSPASLHEELAARWNIMYSLAARASIWRELMRNESAVVNVNEIALHVAPTLATEDVAALVAWRDELQAAGIEVPAAWTLGAGGHGRLLLLYSTEATADDVIEGFAVAWCAAHSAESALLHKSRPESVVGLAAASAQSLAEWRRDAAALPSLIDAAGWQCATCRVDDVSRRIEWATERSPSNPR